MMKAIFLTLLFLLNCFSPPALFAITGEGGGLSSVSIEEFSINNMDVREFVEMLAKRSGLGIVVDQDVTGRVSLFVKNIQPRTALLMALESAGLAFAEEGGMFRVMTAAQYKVKYGYAFGQEKMTKMVRVHFVALKDAAALLDGIKSDTGKVVVNTETQTLVLMDSAEKVRAMEFVLKEIDVQTVTETLSFKYVRAEEALEEIRGMLTSGLGMAKVDLKNNQLIVTDTLSVLERVRRAVAEADVQGRKLVLQAKLVHIALDDEHLSGVDWQGSLENYQNLRLRGKYDFLDGEAQDRILSMGTLVQEDFSTLLEALDMVGLVKEYPLADIMVDRRDEVLLSVKLDDPELSMKRVAVGQKPPSATDAAVLTFLIKPVLSDDGSMVTTVVTNASSINQQNKTSITTTSGEMAVIGGMIATEKVAMIRKVPLMGDIPLLGFAFRYRNSTIKREEFVVFLTPRLAALETITTDVFSVKNLMTEAVK